VGNWNEHDPNTLASNNWRTSLVPAPAVIPAPIVYTKFVAVKKLVVEIVGSEFRKWPSSRGSKQFGLPL